MQKRLPFVIRHLSFVIVTKRIAPLHIWAPQHPRPRALTVPLGAGSRMRQMAQNKKTTPQPRRITAKRMALPPWGQVGSNSSRKLEVGETNENTQNVGAWRASPAITDNDVFE